jgi:hypothetical protein
LPFFASFTKRPYYRNRWFWLAVLFVTYSMAGFFLVPAVIKQQMTKQVKEQLDWNTHLDSVTFNPYTFSLTLNHLEFTDDQQHTVTKFGQIYTDLKFSSLINGVLTISQIRILDPYVNVAIFKDGITNFSQSWDKQHPDKATKTSVENASKKSDSFVPKLLFQRIKIIKGVVSVHDHTQTKPQEITLSSIEFDMNNFATFPQTGGDYQLVLSLGENQRLNWRGNLSIVPMQSTGILKLTNIDSQKYIDYLKPYLPWTLDSGILNVNVQYDFSLKNDKDKQKVHFEVSNAQADLENVSLSSINNHDAILNFKQLHIGPVRYNLQQNKLNINQVALEQPKVQLDRNAKGKLQFLPAPLASKTKDNSTITKSSSTLPPFTWSINSISVNNGAVTWLDLQLKQPAKVQLSQFNFNLLGLSDQLNQSLRYSISYSMPDSGSSQMTGNVVLNPFSIDSKVNLQDIDLKSLSPYISNQTPIKLTSAKLSLNGQVQAGQQPAANTSGNTAKVELKGQYTGDITLNTVSAQVDNASQPIAGWKSLSLRPLTIRFNPFSIRIDDVNLIEPFGRFQINADKTNSLTPFLNNTPAVADQKVADTFPVSNASELVKTTKPKKVISLQIGRFLVNNGQFNYKDQSLKPSFHLQVSQLNGEVNHLTTDKTKPAKINLNALINDTATLSINGTINPLLASPFVDLSIKLNNLQMPPFSGYSGQFVGYKIDKGALSMNLNYLIKSAHLKAENQIILDQFNLGDSVKSDKALSLPLPLALAVIRNNDGVIKLDVPISGDLNDPSFHLGGVIVSAFTQIITKAATAPFTLLATLLDSRPEDLQSVLFADGSAQLQPSAVNTLDKLVKALKIRPSLVLDIQPQFDMQADTHALQNQALQKQVDALREKVNPSAPNALATTTAILEKLLIKNKGVSQLRAIQNTWKVTSLNAANPPAGYAKAISAAIAKNIEITPQTLKKLAQQRAGNIYNYLSDKGKLPAGQLFILAPMPANKSNSKGVDATFKLNVR